MAAGHLIEKLGQSQVTIQKGWRTVTLWGEVISGSSEGSTEVKSPEKS